MTIEDTSPVRGLRWFRLVTFSQVNCKLPVGRVTYTVEIRKGEHTNTETLH
jgi:hypothetical protein